MSLAGEGLRRWRWLGVGLVVVAAIAGGLVWMSRQEPVTPGAPAGIRLISAEQYVNTIKHLFGGDIATPERFAPVRRIQGLVAIGAGSAVVTPGSLDLFEGGARSIAAQVVAPERRAFLIGCEVDADGDDPDCARAFLARTGRLLYRRGLGDGELDDLMTIVSRGQEIGDFYSGLASALSTMLVSPEFLFIRERVEPDPARAGAMRLDAPSRATRLAMLLWNAMPDAMLLDAARDGTLDTPEGLADQVRRMMASSRLEQGVRAFFSDMGILENFDLLDKDPIIYPAFTQKVARDAREQFLRTVVDHVMYRDADYRDLFTTPRTFMTTDLGSVYQLEMPPASSEWFPYTFAESSGRSGILSHLGFLSVYAHAGRSSPTRRGRALREVFLCQKVPDPPPNVDFSIVEDPNANFRTARERLDAHSIDPTCAGCHQLTDPVGLTFENFDGAGQYRAMEGGVTIDASGTLNDEHYDGVEGLGHVLHEDPEVASCLTRRLFAYAVGRALMDKEGKPVTEADGELLDYLNRRFAADGYRVKGLLETIATSKAFYAAVSAEDLLLADGQENTI